MSKKNESDDLKRSRAYRALVKLHCTLDRWFPHGPRAKRVYSLGKDGLRMLHRDKPKKFLRMLEPYVWNRIRILGDYDRWIRYHEPDKQRLKMQAVGSRVLAYRPRISIIMPVWETDKRWLSASIESVIRQTYDNWELCIADGNSAAQHVKETLKKYEMMDSRIKVRYINENKGIAGNSNEAMSMAGGEFIGLLDHDDELAPFALYEIVHLLNKRPEFDYIYTDEDKIDGYSKRFEPFFKPEWSPDYLLACAYTNHLSVYRKDIVDRMGGFRKDLEGSQDYDLLLRFTESIPQDHVGHIPMILYHWRGIPGSTAIDSNAKNSMVIVMAKKALEDAITRRGIKAVVTDGLWMSSYRVKRDITGEPLITIIIPTKNMAMLLKNCISSIERNSTYKNYEIIVVDNDSRERETLEYLSCVDHKVIKYHDEFNFARINNQAAKKANGEYLVFLNNDTEVITPDWLEAMLEHAQVPETGAVGCKLLYKDGSIQHSGVILGMSPDQDYGIAGHIFKGFDYEDRGYFGSINVIRNYSAVTAACMMIRRDAFDKVNGFDERLAVCYNDVDLCLRLCERGYRIVYTPYAELFHLESSSRGEFIDIGEAGYMLRRWGRLLKNDPYYSPNLALQSYDCRISAHPGGKR